MCKCNIKLRFRLFSEIIIDKDKLLNNFIDIKTTTNLYVIKCYKLLLTEEGIKYNIGNYILIFIIIIFIILYLIFRFKHYKDFCEYIKKICKIKDNKMNKDKANQKDDINKENNKNNNSIIDKAIKKESEILNIKKIQVYKSKTYKKFLKKKLKKNQ